MELIGKVDRALSKVEEVALALLLVGMVLLAAVQVLLRNIWDTGIDWADVTLQNVTVIVGLLGAAIATSEGRHLNIDILSRIFRGRARLGLKVAIGLFAVYICYRLTRGGWQTYQANHAGWLKNVPPSWSPGRLLGQELKEGTIPQWLSQIPLFCGFGLIGVHFALRLVRDISSLATGKDWEHKLDKGLEGDAMLDDMVAHASDDDAPTGSSSTPKKVDADVAGKGESDERDDASDRAER